MYNVLKEAIDDMASRIESFYDDESEKSVSTDNNPIIIIGKDGRKYTCVIDKTFLGKTRVSINFCVKKTLSQSANIHEQLTEIINNNITVTVL